MIYWLSSNVWNWGQQTWLITNNPTPGSPAYKKRQEKLRAKAIKKGLNPDDIENGDTPEPTGQRMQPMSSKRQKKKGRSYDPLANGPQDLTVDDGNTIDADDDIEVLGKDGLTDAQRAKKRYERRMAERQRSKEKAQVRAKKQQQRSKKDRSF
mgnify:FL=1